ncbi:hypothetical protein OSB04_002093 [Centaurea solstitialis]|uniref:Retrotransposon gag domain-containing protein n=1 Tax=Centaurea solstitialis TaxID=347529 RepID=A0AA38UA90_9ASTR|nr:hypothetical protein OSB04_002093 [Centaurea solstitialis]
MSRLSHEQLLPIGPDIDKTVKLRRKKQKAEKASSSSSMADENIVHEVDGPPPLEIPLGGGGNNINNNNPPVIPPVFQPELPHLNPPSINQQIPPSGDPGLQNPQGNPANGILQPPPIINQQIEDEEQNIFRLANSKDGRYLILERISNNNGHWVDPRSIPNRSSGLRDMDTQTALVSQLSDIMAIALKKLTTDKQMVSSVQSSETTELHVQCTYCGGEHLFDACPGNPEQKNYVASTNFLNGPFAPTYNPGWRKHPNFSWKSPTLNPHLPKLQGQSNNDNYRQSSFQNHGLSNFQNQKRVHFQDEEAPRFQNTAHNTFKYQINQQQQAEASGSLESMMKGFMTQTQASIKNIETQIGQMALEIKNKPTGYLPSDTEIPQRAETRSDFQKEINRDISQSNDSPKVPGDVSPEISGDKSFQNPDLENFETTPPVVETHVPKHSNSRTKTPTSVASYVPYPQRLRNQKEEIQFKFFLDIFKQFHINIPLVEATEQMPNYAKFLKDILSKKKKLTEYETIALTKECSALVTNKIPPKLKDPGSFTIPCSIGSKTIGKALCDLGAGINLMPLCVFKSLGIGEARPTTIPIQLADKSIVWPKGNIEDVLVRVDKFILPADFIILDCEVDADIPIILGRPFLATGRTLIDVQKGELTMRVQDQDDLGTPLVNAAFEVLDNKDRKTLVPSLEIPPDLELKQLPSHLKYAFLEEPDKLPVIISSTLDTV